MASVTCLTATSILRLISTALAPLFKWLRPAFTISRANKVEVVVPSPATSAVLIAACFTILTPTSSILSFREIDLATVTPSLVDCT